ncbi:hypothetical protein BJY00DRAFT_308870 [Aspergillus carlsbadensis]|nr:hypothetical protein BJY00DRAFT_308870 [Aspergillus carlsbadensis]
MLFTYSSGRFLYNEQTRLTERRVPFNIRALNDAIANSITGHGAVKSLTKLSEGGFNRVLLATMEDGFRAIVKIPYSIAVPKKYATASEVATLTFLRSKGIPVPARSTGGRAQPRTPSGSSTSSWNTSRASGPIRSGTDPTKYLLAVAEKEIKWVEKFGKPIESEFPHNTVFPGFRSPTDYLGLLKKYPQIAPYLLPKGSPNLSRPVLRHPDLTPSNIFIDPTSFKVTSIIDWQHSAITPFFLTAGDPRLFENPDAELPAGLDAPKFPDNYNTLPAEEKAQADELLRRQTLFYLYRVFNGGLNKVHLEALRDPLRLQRQEIVDLAGRQWSGNIISLRRALMRMRQVWPYLVGKDSDSNANIECPIDFSEAEVRDQAEKEEMWYNLNKLVAHWREELRGLSEEGWIPDERYEAAVQRNEELKAEFADGGSPDELEKIERGWPFQDREEFF